MGFGKRDVAALIIAYSLRGQRAAAAVALLLTLALPAAGLHAELLFRSVARANGPENRSPIRKYSVPADVADAQASSASGAPAQVEEVRVFLTGEITREDVEGAAVMARLLKSGKQKLAGNTVWLASNGGSIDAAMDLGRLLRELGVFTVVGKTDQCLSACVFAFMGGERRSVAGRLGIHRPYLPYTQDIPDRQLRYRHMQRILKAYMDELDFPASLYEAVMLVPPESMKFLSPAELKTFYLEGISPSSEDIADAAAARRMDLSMLEYLRYKAKAPECVFPVADQGRCDSKAQNATAGGSENALGSASAGGTTRGAAGSL